MKSKTFIPTFAAVQRLMRSFKRDRKRMQQFGHLPWSTIQQPQVRAMERHNASRLEEIVSTPTWRRDRLLDLGTDLTTPAGLTDVERQILVYKAIGCSNRLAAERLGLKTQTVSNCLCVMGRKLGCVITYERARESVGLSPKPRRPRAGR